MSFVKKTWKDRISEYPNRRIINDGYVSKPVTVSRDEGVITEAGDSLSAANMNDTEDRIFNAVQSGGGGASALDDLTDVDISSPTDGQALIYDGANSKWVNGAGGGSASWTDVTGTLTAGNTSVTLSDASITSNSTFDIYTDTFGVNPTGITVATGSITLTFKSQASDVNVKVRVS